MKTLFNTVLKSTSLAIVLLASVLTLSASAATVDLGADNPDIKKVIVNGNTKVILLQGNSEYVSIDQFDIDKVLVKQIGNTLTISSSENSPVTVYVQVKDLYRIGVSDKASVQTMGTFNVTCLQVILKDNATARVKANTESLYTVVDGQAKLKLVGTTDNYTVGSGDMEKINTEKFAALKTEYANPADRALASNIFKEPVSIKK